MKKLLAELWVRRAFGIFVLVLLTIFYFSLNYWPVREKLVFLDSDQSQSEELNAYDHEESTNSENMTHSLGREAASELVVSVGTNGMKPLARVRIRFIFLVGSEGSGHHFFKSLLYSMRKSSVFSKYFFVKNDRIAENNCDWYESHQLKSSTDHPLWNNLVTEMSQSEFSRAVINGLKMINSSSHEIDVPLLVLLGMQSSYPCCDFAGARNPNLIELYMLIKDLQHWCNRYRNRVHLTDIDETASHLRIEYQLDLRTIVLYRKVENSLYSACTRFNRRASCSATADFFQHVSFPYMMRQLHFFNKYISHQYGFDRKIFEESALKLHNETSIIGEYSDDQDYVFQVSSFVEKRYMDKYEHVHDSQSFFKVSNQDAMISSMSSISKETIKNLSCAMINLFGLPKNSINLESMIHHVRPILHVIETGQFRGRSSAKSKLSPEDKKHKLRQEYQHMDAVLSSTKQSWRPFLIGEFALVQ